MDVKNEEQFLKVVEGRIALEYLKEIKQTLPVRTGDTRDSVTANYTEDGWIIGSTSKVAGFLELGTGIYGPEGKPIIIKAVDKKALMWSGADHPYAKVEIDGMRPRFYFRNIASDQALAENIIKRVLDSL